MVLLLLTASHREMDLAELERVSTGSRSVAVAAKNACRALRGVVTVSTCNRFELYLDVDASGETLRPEQIDHAREHAGRLIAQASGVSAEAATASFTVRTGVAVVRHLFRVVAGLESMVIGEREIAGQVKRSLHQARTEGTTSKALELLFQSAARVSKQVASSTVIGGFGRSLVSIALDSAEPHLVPWPATQVTLIGTGSYAGAVVAALRRRGCTAISVYSRSGRAGKFAASHGVEAIPDVDATALVSALCASDLVVAVSGIRGQGPDLAHLVEVVQLERARNAAGSGQLVVIDLALHRDIDPRVRDSAGVVHFDLAALRTQIPPADAAVIAQAAEIVESGVSKCWSRFTARDADPLVAALVDAAECQVEEEVASELQRRRAANLTTLDDASVQALSRAVRRRVHRQLHEQISKLQATTGR